jgi:hypothetical protein
MLYWNILLWIAFWKYPHHFIMNNLMATVNISFERKEFISHLYPYLTTTTASPDLRSNSSSLRKSFTENNLLVLIQENINKDRALLHNVEHSQRRPIIWNWRSPIKNLVLRTTEIFFFSCLKLAQFEFLKNKAA